MPAEGETATHELVPANETHDGIERDEADWVLDEAVSATQGEDPDSPPPPYSEESVETLVRDIQPAKNGGATSKKGPTKLPFPVILPSRRPGSKSRGFVRAYAPVLEESGIDQEMFLSFLKNFHSAMQASPIFDVLNVATMIAGFYPDFLVGLAIQAVQIAVLAGQEIQERYRLNKFLDHANKEIFIPKGLFAMIVKWKPGPSEHAEVSSETVDLGATAMAKYGDALLKPGETNVKEEGQKKGTMDNVKEKMKQLRIESGATHESEMPVTCSPLIFPALDSLAAASSAREEAHNESMIHNIKAKSKSSLKFVNDYYDRRAQAAYVCVQLLILSERAGLLTSKTGH